eukprot:c15410_g1_i1.p1 GENE.c15410_g1_i1~~c15410_g1_i1.p1  ORF type:complete len:441 (-),score=151.47 c15410_g1_i1:25-1326(-)
MSAVNNTKIEEAKALAKSGNVAEALQTLLNLEKTCRLNLEVDGTVSAAEAVIQVCFDAGNWKQLNEHILLLSKRRSQLKQVIVKVVQMAWGYLELKPSPFDYLATIELIETLRAVSAGKIFVENERARLTKKLSKIREDEGKLDEAADILQEISPETLGSMERLEKVDIILEQMRQSLARKDFIRAGLVSNKINPKTIAGPEFEEVRIRYHKFMIEYFHDQHRYLDISKAYFALYSCDSIAKNEEAKYLTLKRVVIFLLLSPYGNEQSDFLARLNLDKELENIPVFQEFLKLFCKVELITWPLDASVSSELVETSNLWDGHFTPRLLTDVHKRVIEHNIRVVSKYYKRIRSGRLAQVLGLSVDAMEESISEMVSSKAVHARIDRVDEIVVFQKAPVSSEILNNWARDISTLLSTVENTCHLIKKENVLHGISA